VCTLETHAMIAEKAAAAEEASQETPEPVQEDPFCGLTIGHEPHFDCPGYVETIPQINGL